MSRKLKRLVEIEGYVDEMDMLKAAMADSVVPSICMNEGCDYTTGMEPDQSEGWCEECGTGTVTSCLILAGIM